MEAATNAEIRAWARANGHVVADRGRIPMAVVAAHRAAPAGRSGAAAADGGQPAKPSPEQDEEEEEAPVAGWPASDASFPTWSGGTEPPPRPWPAPPAWDPAPPPWRPAPPTQPAEGNDGVANAALWLGLIPLAGGILGIVLGIIALRRIRQSGRPGRSAAQAGIAVGACWLLIFGAVAIAVGREADRDASGTVTSRGTVTARDLRTGDCPSSLPDGTFTTMDLVPCARPHLAEVYGTFSLSGSEYPGVDQMRRFANGGCAERLTPFVGPGKEATFRLFHTTPTEQSWEQGDRNVRCLLTTRDGSPLPGGSAKAP